MKKIILGMMALASCSAISAQTDVTKTYLDNPDFGARFAAWENPGSMTYNVANTFEKRSGEVWMEKWVAKGSRLGTNTGMYQNIDGLKTGTYTLVAAGQHINQNSLTTKCTGAYFYANDAQTMVQEPADYSVVFTVVNGKATVGAKLASATGNWFCIDNFRLYYKEASADSIDIELDKLITTAENVYKADGVDADQLQAAIDAVKALKGKGAEGVTEAATALERATLNFRVQNATGTAPKVTTHPYVAMGTTIALGRLTVSGTASEKGFCWSKDPNPTILDNTSTLYYDNNGQIYHMDKLEPGTIYYVRAYARTSGYKVGYGDVVKIATLPRGQVSYGYDYAGDEETNNRINSACAETVWMYNNLSNIRGFYLNVHYVPGSGAGGGTADCSYGGWMRVSQNVPYQQTGTILHETNHGVGVGTTGEWYNNSNLRSETSRGLWLGPRATQMVRFFDNNTTSTLNGDGTHMWPYGINGAHEDSYQPSKKVLYFANILVTHALHQDGLKCSSGVGFATPAYVFTQDDNTKYYIKCESSDNGGKDAYLGLTGTGVLRNMSITAAEALQDDNYAWYVTYDPTTSYYMLQNVGSGRYLTYDTSTNSFKAVSRTKPTAAEKMHMMPSRADVTIGKFKGSSFWMLSGNSSHKAMTSGTYSTTSKSYPLSSSNFDAANAAVAQRWFFMTADEANAYEAGMAADVMSDLDVVLENVKKTVATPHLPKTEEGDLAAIDEAANTAINTIETEKGGYTSVSQISDAITTLNNTVIDFLAAVKPASMAQPFDITYMLINPDINTNCTGWSVTTAVNYSCAEFFEKSADFNQTTKLKVPAGTYQLKAQAFQRPGSYTDVYNDWKAGTNGVKGQLYVKTTKKLLKNIYEDAQKLSVTGAVSPASGVYVPNSMQGASNFFKKGLYENEVMTTTTGAATMKVGIVTNMTTTASWTIFDNFRLYYFGNYSIQDYENYLTPVQGIRSDVNTERVIYDMSGRRVNNTNAHGIYIINGKKVVK